MDPKPEDPRLLDDLEVACFVHVPRHGAGKSDPCQNDTAKMLISFHHVVWICAFLLFLVHALLFAVFIENGPLIKERVKLVHVCAISSSSGITFLKKFGLRLVLLLWIVFSLYLSIICNTTFTSARIETEHLLEDQVRDSGQSLISTIPTIGLSWICITGNRPSSYLALYSAIIDTFLEKIRINYFDTNSIGISVLIFL